MRSPDGTDVERIEGLLRGMPPESEREARLEGLIRELRTNVAFAPPDVRERVRSLREPERPVRKLGWRPALVLVPLVLAFAGAALLDGRGGDGDLEAGGAEAVETTAALMPAYDADSGTTADAGSEATQEQSRQAIVPAPTDASRAQEWDVTLELRVPDNDRLSDASADAIRTTRELGGFVVSSNVSTQGTAGESRLVVRVPTRRIQDAIARFSELGTITAQNVAIQDRQADLDRLARRIDTLRVQIAELNLRLRTEQLDQAERLRLELRRQRLTGLVNSLTSQRKGVANEVAMAEVQLTIRTGASAAAAKEGRIEDAAGSALHVLALAGAAAVFLGILLAPVLAVAALVLLVRRGYRRRTDERLLDRTHPAADR